MRRLIKIVLTLVILLLISGAGLLWYRSREGEQAVVLRTAPVSKGDLVVTIKATGTVEPQEVVDVGAQVAGQILSFGKDDNGKPIDYGSVVDEGTVLAQIDDSLYQSDAATAAAQVQLASAGLQSAQANLEQMNAKLYQAQRDWERAQKLGPSEALAQTSFDSYKAAFETAKANVSAAQAAIEQAKASIAQADSSQERAQRNLGYCTIKSPVKGVIIDRRVNIGQTVVSSLNAPSLFLIAKDLTRMQVWVAVNEAEIGKIRPGQPVTFTVDAFPGEPFKGEVGKVRLNASMTQQVVTYTVEITTDNSNGRLLPYLTADVLFEVARRDGALMVPNAALQWKPSADQVAPQYRSEQAQAPAGRQGEPQGGQQPASQPGKPAGEAMSRGIVWVMDGTYVRPIPVRVGLTDDVNTEVQGEGLAEGTEVVTGAQTAQTVSAQTEAKSPFVPQFPRRGGAGGRGAGGGAGGGGARGAGPGPGGPP
jgi:HlyD family secretion protein